MNVCMKAFLQDAIKYLVENDTSFDILTAATSNGHEIYAAIPPVTAPTTTLL